ncbi:MFS transporter [Zoogloea sp.]|uniref:MFS transporter n=1 Tax=Zoogloea sp. TaxID=49181 RepID=UPI001416AA64|nr:MAG: MFS transporter [Zoogloea sp.]
MSTDISIPGLIDDTPLGAYHWRLFGLLFVIALFDGFDTQAIAYTAPAITQAFGLAGGALAPIMTAGVVGMAIGAMSLGLIGDKIGRRPALLGGVTVFSLATLMTAFAASTGQIIVLRFIAGLGMGGCTPVLLALAAEYAPSKYRGSVMTGLLLGLPAGAMLGGLLAARMLPAIGWQGIFLAGGIAPLALLGLLVPALPESLQYLVSKGGASRLARVRETLKRMAATLPDAEAAFSIPESGVKTSVKALFTPGNRRNTVAIWATYFFNWVAWFLFLSWLPTVLKAGGLPAGDAPMGTVTVNFAFIVCAIPLSVFLPRLNIRLLLGCMFAIGLLVCLGLHFSGTNWTWVFIFIAAAGFGIGGQQIVLNYLVVGSYPTALRATATGWAIGSGRVGAIIGSFIGGQILADGGPSGFYLSLMLPLALAAVAVFIIRPRGEAIDPASAIGH